MRRVLRWVIGGAVMALSVANGPVLAQTASGPSAARLSAPLVRIPFPQEDGGLTPYSFDVGYPLLMLIYDSVMWRDTSGVPQPWLAQSVEPSADARSITIRLRQGASWQDGPPVTSTDIAFTFRYFSSHPQQRFTAETRQVDRVDTPDPNTAVIALRQPGPGFADQTLADLPILPEHIWRSLAAGHAAPDGLPVGSGPYRLVEHRAGQSYRFASNPSYFRGAPAVAEIDVPIITDAERTLTAFETDKVDMLPETLRDADATRLQGGGARLTRGAAYLGTVLLLNTRKAPFDRPEVRQAVNQAIDPGRIARVVGNAVAADRGQIHPDSTWAAPSTLHAVDELAAHNLLSTMRLAPIQVLAPDNDTLKLTAARQVAIALVRAGVSAEAKPVPQAEIAKAIGEDGSAPTFVAAIQDAPALQSYDPDFLHRVYGTGVDSTFNYTGYTSPAFEDLSRRISTTTDMGARHSLTAEELRLLEKDAPAIPLFFANGTFAHRPSIYQGWNFIRGSGIFDKRSFVEPRAVAAGSSACIPASGCVAPHAPSGESSWSGRALVVVAGFTGLVLVIGLVVAARRSRAG